MKRVFEPICYGLVVRSTSLTSLTFAPRTTTFTVEPVPFMVIAINSGGIVCGSAAGAGEGLSR